MFAIALRLLGNRWVAGALVLALTHGGAWWHGYDTRRDADAARVQEAQVAQWVAQARVIGLAEAQAQAVLERDRLRVELDNAARIDPDADRMCLGADSVRRLATP